MRRLALPLLLAVAAVACKRQAPGPPKLPRASQVVVERWRMLKELGPVQAGLAELETKVFGATSTDAKLWLGYRERAKDVRERAETLARHHATDVKWLVVIRTSSDPGLVDAFVRQANEYAAAARRSAVQLDDIVARLHNMTRDPRSWTEKEFREAAVRYQQSREDMRRSGAAMAALLERI